MPAIIVRLKPRRLANSTMKLSLMNAWTDTMRRGFQMTMMQALGRMQKTDWASLSTPKTVSALRGDSIIGPDGVLSVEIEPVEAM